jgi:hypothetical protein
MTPIFTCGWECGVKSGQAHWTDNAGTTASFSTTTVRSGSRSLRVNPTAELLNVQSFGAGFTAAGRWVGRVYIRFATLPSADWLRR